MLLFFFLLGMSSGLSGFAGENTQESSDPTTMTGEIRDYISSTASVGDRENPMNAVYGTAGDWYSMALDEAVTWSSDAIPVVIFNTDTLVTDGTARSWGYSFYSSIIDSVLFIEVIDALVQFTWSQPPLFTDPISGGWIDSDDVVPFSEAHGGSQYRDTNIGVLTQAFLVGQLYDPCISNSYYWTVGYTSESSNEFDIYVKGTSQNLYGYEYGCEGSDVTTSDAFQVASQKALEWAADAGLFRVQSLGSVDELGRSSGWSFEFLSLDRGSKRFYQTCDDSACTDRSAGVVGGWIPEVTGGSWLDSQTAMEIAESSGGAVFRIEHPLTSASASLSEPVTLPFGEHLWIIRFKDLSAENLQMLVGAESGEFRGSFDYKTSLDSLFTSDLYLAEAEAAARSWSDDAVLSCIVNVTPLSFPYKGKADAWAFIFHSALLNGSTSVTVQATDAGPRVALEPFSDSWTTDELAAGWLGSDSILVIAGQAGGDAVGGGVEEPVIGAIMTKGIYPQDVDRLVWLVSYHSSCQSGHFYLDAYSGEILDGGLGADGDEILSPVLPHVAVLMQNYPNPFNPQTTIRYLASESSAAHVTLKIYDIHGRFVTTLVDAVKEAGEHTVQWDGRNTGGEPVYSGIYFMRLEAGGSRAVRKMILMK